METSSSKGENFLILSIHIFLSRAFSYLGIYFYSSYKLSFKSAFINYMFYTLLYIHYHMVLYSIYIITWYDIFLVSVCKAYSIGRRKIVLSIYLLNSHHSSISSSTSIPNEEWSKEQNLHYQFTNCSFNIKYWGDLDNTINFEINYSMIH